MFRFTTVISFLLTVFLAALLLAVAGKAAGKAVLVVFLLPTYLVGSCALLVGGLLSHYVFRAAFKPAFLVAVAVSTLVMIGGDAWLSDEPVGSLLLGRWPMYCVFLGVHVAAYLWFGDVGRYQHFRARF